MDDEWLAGRTTNIFAGTNNTTTHLIITQRKSQVKS